MQLARMETLGKAADWRDALVAACEMGWPTLFNVEWLMDRAESGEWSGLWW